MGRMIPYLVWFEYADGRQDVEVITLPDGHFIDALRNALDNQNGKTEGHTVWSDITKVEKLA